MIEDRIENGLSLVHHLINTLESAKEDLENINTNSESWEDVTLKH